MEIMDGKRKGEISCLGKIFTRGFVITKNGEIEEVFPPMLPPHGFDDNKVYTKEERKRRKHEDKA